MIIFIALVLGILGAGAALAATSALSAKDYEELPAGTKVGVALGYTTAGVCAFAIATGFMYPASISEAGLREEATSTTNIASFANTQEIEGETGTFLTSGRIGEKTVFRYVEKHDDGAFTLESRDAPNPDHTGATVQRNEDGETISGAVIIEDATEDTARIEVHKCYYKDAVAEFLRDGCGELVEFHVPEGTVSRDYSLDPAAD